MSKQFAEVEQGPEVYYVYTNSDLTEGRGYPVLIGVAKLKETAERFAKGRGIMGSPAQVDKGKTLLIDGIQYTQSHNIPFIPETKEDRELSKKNKGKEELQQALKKSLSAGVLSTEDYNKLIANVLKG